MAETREIMRIYTYLQACLQPACPQVRTRYMVPVCETPIGRSPLTCARCVELSDVLCTVVSKPE